MFADPPKRILWCYGVYQQAYNQMQEDIPNITFMEGLPDQIDDYFDGKEPACLVLDDLMFSGANSQDIAKICTQGSHNKNVSIFILVQNVFHRGNYMRCISLNCRYIIVMRNNRDKSQIVTLGKQLYPYNTRFLRDAYEDSIKLSKYGYLFLDLNHEEDSMRVRTQIFPDELHYVYVIKNK